MIFDIIIFSGTGFCIFMGGWLVRGMVNADYKKRWLDANKVIQGDPALMDMKKLQDLEVEVKQLREEKQKLLSAPNGGDTSLLLTLPPRDRYDLEKTRLQEGYEPIDPLTNLPPAFIVAMKKNRLKEGWDE